jgi:phosphotransferase system HPr-like phosphotransfer protein
MQALSVFSELVIIGGTFKEHSGNIQGTFREHSRNVQGIFGERAGNRDLMQALSVFSLPVIYFVDAIVGAKNCMRVDAIAAKSGKKLTLRATHHNLESAVRKLLQGIQFINHKYVVCSN